MNQDKPQYQRVKTKENLHLETIDIPEAHLSTVMDNSLLPISLDPDDKRGCLRRKWEQRSCTHKLHGFQKFCQLVFSPRTIILQLTSFLMIYITTNIEWCEQNIHSLGSSVNISVVTVMMSFTLIFSINHSFQRRERTLQDVARFKANLSTIYYCLYQSKQIDIYSQIKKIFKHLVQYMIDRNELRYKRLHSMQQKKSIAGFYQIAYELFDLAKMPGNAPKESFLSGQIQSLIEMFERIIATKDYNTPLSIRTFSSMMIYLFPFILAPYFVWNSPDDSDPPYGGAYFWAWLFFLLYGALLDVKKHLDDIFNGLKYEEDIQIHIKEDLQIMEMPIKLELNPSPEHQH